MSEKPITALAYFEQENGSLLSSAATYAMGQLLANAYLELQSALAAEQKRREEAQADNARLRDTLEGIRDLAQNPADHPLDRGQKTRERSAKEVCGEMSDTFLLIEGMADSALAQKPGGGTK